MIKRILWLMVSSLMALSLVLAACAPKVTEEKEVVTEEKEVVTEEKKVATEEKEVVTKKKGEMVVDALGRLVPKPQYGGVLNFAHTSDPTLGFRRTELNTQYAQAYLYVANESLVRRDRKKGPAGTGEWEGMGIVSTPPEFHIPWLAESYEIIQPDTLKFKIRKGVHWQDKAPTYGMELTAEDVVYTFLARWARAGSAFPRSYDYISNLKNPEKSIYLDPDDPWTVVFKSAPGQLGNLWERVAWRDVIVPKALGAIEGEGFGDWRGVVGTGPMLLTDYVMGSSLTWQRNPNYWAKDEFHPQNQLPYIDGIKSFIIPDLSTRQAALRAGKLDLLVSVGKDEAESLRKTNPELLSKGALLRSATPLMRYDVAPFNDIRVRRAMMMAIDKDEIVRDYYGGEGEKFYYPAWPISEHKDAYVPLEQMPRSVQELYEYHPDKAKQLLAEAGYPNGFTTSVIVSAASEENIDLASIVAAYWAKVGVTLKLDIKEPAVYSTMVRLRTYPHGNFGTSPGPNEIIAWFYSKKGSVMNYSMIDDPLIEEMFQATGAAYFNWAELSRIIREVTPELQNRALFILLPIGKMYFLWQPWLKGYHGEERPEVVMGDWAQELIGRYAWIDQGLKKTAER